MPQINFLGPTYNSRSSNIDISRCINLYPELNSYDSKSVIALIGTPGTSLFCNVGETAIRGMHVFNNLMYVVLGPNLYSVNGAGQVSSSLGTLGTISGRVSMNDNGIQSAGIGGNQLIIIDGVTGYIYNISTGNFSNISGGGFPSLPNHVTFIDGYFVVSALGNMSFFVSNLYDGTTWNPLATSPVSASPDPIQTLFQLHQQLWIIKKHTSEIWYDTGTPTSIGSPFSRISGAVIDFGTSAPWSWARGDNSFFGLATQRSNESGENIGVVEIQGYTPVVISPTAITYQIGKIPYLDDSFGYCYSAEGHSFYVITFPYGNATFVYDSTTRMWHERSTYNVPGEEPMPVQTNLVNTVFYRLSADPDTTGWGYEKEGYSWYNTTDHHYKYWNGQIICILG